MPSNSGGFPATYGPSDTCGINARDKLNRGRTVIPLESLPHQSVDLCTPRRGFFASPSCLCSTLVFSLFGSSETCLELPQGSHQNVGLLTIKLYFDVLLFGNNYSVPKMLAYLLLVQKDDNKINVAPFPKVHQRLSQC